jgi:hypothetical protein
MLCLILIMSLTAVSFIACGKGTTPKTIPEKIPAGFLGTWVLDRSEMTSSYVNNSFNSHYKVKMNPDRTAVIVDKLTIFNIDYLLRVIVKIRGLFWA